MLNHVALPCRQQTDLRLPQALAAHLQMILDHRLAFEFFVGLDDFSALPILCELAQDYSCLQLVLKERSKCSEDEMEVIRHLLAQLNPGIQDSFLSALLASPSLFCIRKLIKFAARGSTNASFLETVVPKFQKLSMQQIDETIELLDYVEKWSMFESTQSYSEFNLKDYRVPLPIFLKQIKEMPKWIPYISSQNLARKFYGAATSTLQL